MSAADPRNGRIKYVRLWINEMRGRMSSLSVEARGAYVSLLLEYWNRQAPLPDDSKLLCRITSVSKRDWPGIRDELLEVFNLVDGHLVDEYADRCISEFLVASARGKANVRRRYDVVDGLKDVAS